MKIRNLGGAWRMRKAGACQYYNVVVPTTVCTDRMANGLLEDPYYRDNEDIALKAMRDDYEYAASQRLGYPVKLQAHRCLHFRADAAGKRFGGDGSVCRMGLTK